MTTKSVSNRSVEALRCPSGADRVFLWDDALAGFGVAAFPSGKKVYVAQFRQNGRSRRMTLGEHGRLTPKEARKAAKRVLGAVEEGEDPIEERRATRDVRSFKDVADEFIRLHAEAKKKPRTAKSYAALLRFHILPAFGSRRILDVRKADVARFHAKLSQSPGAANRCLALISTIWNWAADRDEVPAAANPAKGIERNPEKGNERFLTSEEIGRLGDALRLAETEGIPWTVDETQSNAKHIAKKNRRTIIDQYAAAAIRLLILTGARLSEILDTRWDYVDFERAMLVLPDSKTGRKTIYLSAPALAVLESIPRATGNPYIIAGHGSKQRKAEGPDTKKDSKGGKPRADLKNPWAAVARAAGFFETVTEKNASGKLVEVERSTVRLHDLRHSFASVGAGASLGLPILGKLLGHAQASTTARYSHLEADPMHRAANIIGGQIAAALEGRTAEVVRLKSGAGR